MNNDFLAASLAVLKSKQPPQSPSISVRRISEEHPLFSQYNILKTRNEFHSECTKLKGHKIKHCKKCSDKHDVVQKCEFERYLRYQLSSTVSSANFEDHIINRTSINMIAEIINSGVKQRADSNEIWAVFKKKEMALRAAAEHH